MFWAHIGPVTASAPAFGTISTVPLSFAALAIAIATPECTVPMMHVDVVALDQLVDVVGGLGRIGLVVDLDVFDLAAAELAALLLDVQPEAVLDRDAQRRVGAAVRQHQADLELALLGVARAWRAARRQRPACRGMTRR